MKNGKETLHTKNCVTSIFTVLLSNDCCRYYGSDRLKGQHILTIVLSVVALVTNLLTLAAICIIRRRLSANQTMMLSLCCADLLSAIGILATTTSQHYYDMHRVAPEQREAATCVYKIVTVRTATPLERGISAICCR